MPDYGLGTVGALPRAYKQKQNLRRLENNNNKYLSAEPVNIAVLSVFPQHLLTSHGYDEEGQNGLPSYHCCNQLSLPSTDT